MRFSCHLPDLLRYLTPASPPPASTTPRSHFRAQAPYMFLEPRVGSSDPSNVTYPYGTIEIDPGACEVTDSNPEQ